MKKTSAEQARIWLAHKLEQYRTTRKLEPADREVLLASDRFIDENGYGPSLQQIAEALGYGKTWAWRRMEFLKAAGWVTSGKHSTKRQWTPTYPGIAKAIRFGASLAQTFDDIDAMKRIHENRFQD